MSHFYIYDSSYGFQLSEFQFGLNLHPLIFSYISLPHISAIMLKLLAKFFFKLNGWSLNLDYPPESERCIMTAAPHTTNWDFIYMRVAFFILEIPMKVAIKKVWTKFPFGLLIKPLGGLGIERKPRDKSKPRRSYTEQMADFFKEHERIAMVIAPEGTRKLQKEWKMGFYHAAKMAGVPITFGYLDYEKKEAGVGGVLYPTDDIEADMKKMMEFYKTIKPKYDHKFMLDQRYWKAEEAG